MTAITYKDATQRAAFEKVYLDGKLVGYIRQDSYGYYYEPISGKSRGVSYGSVRAVHHSLED